MIASFIQGFSYLFRGLALLRQPGIRRYVIIPLLLNIGIFGAGIWYSYAWFQEWFQEWFSWLNSFFLGWLQWIVIPILFGTLATAVFYSFSAVANLVAAPFNSLLAEQVEFYLTGRFPEEEAMGWGTLVTKTVPLLWNEIHKTLYALLWAIPFLLLFVIPFINIAAPFLWLAYSAWILAIQYLDFPMGNHTLTGKQIRQQARSARLLSLGFGGAVLLLTAIPFVNFLAMPAAVAGASLLWVERFLPEKDRIMSR